MPKLRIFIIFFLIFWPVLAQAFLPQLNYPRIGGIDLDLIMAARKINLGQIFLWAYYGLVIIGGVVAFWGLVIGGIKWMIYGGTIPATLKSPPQMSEAKKQVIASMLGLLILLASWITLNFIDPALVRIPELKLEPLIRYKEPQLCPAKIFDDGYIIKTTLRGFEKLEIPKGKLKVEDTSRFPVGGGRVADLNGIWDGERTHDFLSAISTFRDPADISSCVNIIPPIPRSSCPPFYSHCEPLYYHGVLCYFDKNFQGLLKICTSQLGENCSLKMPTRDERPCQSILGFKQPFRWVYKDTDQIIFYAKRLAEAKDPRTGEVEGQACIKIGKTALPEKCKVVCDILNQSGIYRIKRGNANETWGCEPVPGAPSTPGIVGLQGLCIPKMNKEGDTVIGNYLPLSMEIVSDKARKYLILLFEEGGDFSLHDRGLFGPMVSTGSTIRSEVYTLTKDVQAFDDTIDERLYWLQLPNLSRETQVSSCENEPAFKPASVLILPLESIEE